MQLFGGGSSTPPPPPAPPPPPSRDDAAANAQAELNAQMAARNSGGYQSTILTSGQGTPGAANVQKKTLLGA